LGRTADTFSCEGKENPKTSLSTLIENERQEDTIFAGGTDSSSSEQLSTGGKNDSKKNKNNNVLRKRDIISLNGGAVQEILDSFRNSPGERVGN